MAKLSDRGMAIKLRLMERGETQKDLIEKVRKTDPSFDSKTLYDLMYRDRVSKYTPVVLSLLGIESEERAAENVGPCADGKTASAGMNPTTADAVPLPLTREALGEELTDTRSERSL